MLHLQTIQQRALQGEYDRQMDFGRGGGLWVVRLSVQIAALSSDDRAHMAVCQHSGLSAHPEGPLCLCRSMAGATRCHRPGTRSHRSIAFGHVHMPLHTPGRFVCLCCPVRLQLVCICGA